MIDFFLNKAVILRNYLVYKKYSFLAGVTLTPFPLNPNANFVISVASYPKRIHHLPAVFEALTHQTISPKHAFIVLSEEEWPDLIVPKYIEKLVKRGVQIVWTKDNPYAVKKLVPIYEKYPDLGIVTFDDDFIYGKRVIEKLINSSGTKDGIVGHVGKVLYRKGNKLGMNFRSTVPANLETNSHQVYFLGGSGTLYPAKSLDVRVADLNAIKSIVPGRGSDIWFWAAAVAAETPQVCLGTPTNKELGIPIPQNKKTSPKDIPGKEIMEQRFQMAIDFFGIREKLQKNLPDCADL